MRLFDQRPTTSDQHPAFGIHPDERKDVPRRGFTLIEMIIVISIISVLLALLYSALECAQKFSRRTITYSELKTIEAAFRQYRAHYHAWPGSTNLVQINTQADADGENDVWYVINENIALMLQGYSSGSSAYEEANPDQMPFLEFSRKAANSPVNPFKSSASGAGDTSRSYKVIFDTGNHQITIPLDSDAPGTTTTTNLIADIAVWTVIPGSRKTNASGTSQSAQDVIFGSWQTFGASD